MIILRVAPQRKVGEYACRYRKPQPTYRGKAGSSNFKHSHYMSAILGLQLVCADDSLRSLVALVLVGVCPRSQTSHEGERPDPA